ncbi:MAG: biotin carboxyl carrier protein [Betaproteobacteria bacterium]|nr:biotin carboxyl carrier protein [Betaproteobacteria bacterium]
MDEVKFVDTTLRDGHSCLWAKSMRTGMMLPVAAAIDRAGFQAFEIISNTNPKKMVRDLREDPWELLDLIRERMPNTPMRVICGRHVQAFQLTPRAIDELWYERLAAHGVRQARISDSSNTAAGWRAHVGYARRVGIDPVVNLIYSLAPKYSDAYYAQRARQAAALDVLRICLKDPGGLLTPERIRTLVPVILHNTGGKEVELHTHCNTGLGPQCAVEAIKFGIGYINTAIPPLADANSNPSVFNVAMNARALGYRTAIDEEALKAVERHFAAIARAEGLPTGAPSPYDIGPHVHQIPGGMVSNLRHQLASARLEHKLDEVVAEIGRVRMDFGCPIMVTPYAQFVGVQATMNVILGERYQQASDEVIQFALGLWGEEESASMDANVRDRILELPRAKELARWQPPEPTLKEFRNMYGGPGVSDDELLLRYLAGEDQVAAMRAAGPFKQYSPADGQGLVSLIEDLTRRRKIGYIQVQKDAMSLTLKSG